VFDSIISLILLFTLLTC